jgi:hypothetical protein
MGHSKKKSSIIATYLEHLQQKSTEIEKEFNAIIHSQSTNEPCNKKLIAAIKQLKTNTLLHFKSQEKMFDYTNCLIIIKSLKSLLDKVNINYVTPKDISDFHQATELFQTKKWFLTVIAAIIGAISGLIVGFAIGGLPGAATGAIVGGITAYSSSLFYARKKDPLIQLAHAAQDTLQKEPEAESLVI